MLDQLKPLTTSKMNCGSAQLTRRGILQHQQNGIFLRNTYQRLLGDWPEAIKEMNLVSTDYSRTILSLISLVSAMEPKWCQESVLKFYFRFRGIVIFGVLLSYRKVKESKSIDSPNILDFRNLQTIFSLYSRYTANM